MGKVETDVLLGDVADSVRGLWRDPGIREAVCCSCTFQLSGSAWYYFGAIHRMADPHYVLTSQDILRSRVKMTGITVTAFKIGEFTMSKLVVSKVSRGSGSTASKMLLLSSSSSR